MNHTFIDFNKISKALSSCAETLKNASDHEDMQIDGLLKAESDLRQALSFCLSTTK